MTGFTLLLIMFYSVYNLGMSGSAWGCDWESFRMVGAWRIWAESQWNLFTFNQVSISPCLQTLSCSFILSFPWWLFCLDFCCKKQINTWNFVIVSLAWQCSSAGQGDAGQGKVGFARADCTPGEWGVKVRDSCLQMFLLFGLKNLVWAGRQPHSCCTDFCAVLMSVN